MNILFVDDDQEVLKQAELFLKDEIAKLEMETTTSAKKALELLNARDYDAVISDFKMSEMDGIEFLKNLREDMNSDIPYIVFTGKGREEVAMEALNLGANRYIRKGGDPLTQYGVLAFAIEEEVEDFRKEREIRKERERLNAVLDATSEVIFTKDTDGKYTTVNEAYSKLLGCSQDELLGSTARDVFPSEEAKRLTEIDKEVMETGEPKRSLDKLTVNGEIRMFDTQKVPLRNEEDEIVGLCGFANDVTELKETEEMLEETSALMEMVIQDANVWLDVVDEDGNVVIWNRAAERISGYSKEEVVGNDEIWRWLYPDEEYRTEIIEASLQIREEGESVEQFETTIETKSGEERIISWNFQALGEKDNNLRGSVAVGRDITERKEKEGELRESEKKYRSLVENVHDGIFIFQENELKFVNDRICEITGYGEQELYQMNVWELIHPEDREKVKEIGQRRQEGKEAPNNYEARILTKNDNVRDLEFRVTRVTYEGEESALASVRDITEEKEHERELTEKKEEYEEIAKKYQLIVEEANDLISFIDFDGEILFANKAHEEILGYDSQELISKNVFDFHHPEDEERIEESFENLLEEGRLSLEARLECKDGSYKWFEVLGNVMRGDEVESDRILLVARDITSRKESEEEIKISELFNSLNDAAFVHDLNGNFLKVNDAACELLGYSREELLAVGLSDIEGKYSASDIENRIERVSEREEIAFETVHVAKTGRRIPVEISSNLIEYEGKKAILTVASDITDRKKAEFKKMRESISSEIHGDILEEINEEFNSNFTAKDLDLRPLLGNLVDLGTDTSPSQILDMIVRRIKRKLGKEDIDVERNEVLSVVERDVVAFVREIMDLAEENYIEIPQQYEEFDEKFE